MADDELPDRYDRQVRLWGEHGQRSIGQASVAVLGSCALSTEILKSLVLAGIGSYKIFDEDKVGESDTGNNFFVTCDDLYKPRAEVVTRFLNELNPLVKGSYTCRNFNTSSSLSVFNGFSLVVGVRMPLDVAEYIADYLYKRNIPFVWATCVGLIGYFRLSFKEHEVLHDHRELPPHDFRLQKPFDAFKDFVDGMDLKNMKQEQHSHIPYVILLLKTLEIWRNSVGDLDALPVTFKMRKEFTTILMSMQKLNDQGLYNEDNFEEAKQQIIKSFAGIELNENVQKLFNDPRSDSSFSTEQNCSIFWTHVAAVKHFYKQHGYLPLSGTLPDMISDTITYTTLVNLFRDQARAEATEIHDYIKTLQNYQASVNDAISFSETVNYCKNFSRLNFVTGSNLSDEFKNGFKPVFAEIAQHLEAGTDILTKNVCLQDNGDATVSRQEVCPLVWLVILRASEYFFKGKNRYPGTNGVPCTIDAKDLLDRVKKLLDKTEDPQLITNFDKLVPEHVIDEICRYGNAELNFIASILGGVIAQEIIKLCTQQYTPVDNTFIFDGNTQKSAIIRL